MLQAVRLPAMMTELMFSSFETIARRSWMLAQGKCSPTEFARMVLEKQQALSLSGFALLSGASAASILAPFHRGATLIKLCPAEESCAHQQAQSDFQPDFRVGFVELAVATSRFVGVVA